MKKELRKVSCLLLASVFLITSLENRVYATSLTKETKFSKKIKTEEEPSQFYTTEDVFIDEETKKALENINSLEKTELKENVKNENEENFEIYTTENIFIDEEIKNRQDNILEKEDLDKKQYDEPSDFIFYTKEEVNREGYVEKDESENISKEFISEEIDVSHNKDIYAEEDPQALKSYASQASSYDMNFDT